MYIIPHKYTNIETSILGVASSVVNFISKNGDFASMSELQDHILTSKGEGARENFYFSIYLLFSLGKIEYSKKNDLVILLH